MKKKEKDKLFSLFVLLLLTALMLSSSTYAWFSANRLLTINTLNIQIESAGGIEISSDAVNWKANLETSDLTSVHTTTYPNSTNQLPTIFEPVSTGGIVSNGRLEMFYGRVNNNGSNLILTAERSIESESSGLLSTGKFMAFDFFVKTTTPKDLYITKDSGVFYEGENELGIENAFRIAFLNEGNTPSTSEILFTQNMNRATQPIIWEPNYDTHTIHGQNNALSTYGINVDLINSDLVPYDGIIANILDTNNVGLSDANVTLYPALFKKVNIDISTSKENDVNNHVLSIDDGVTKIRIYVWVEGQDVDCEDNASIGNVSFTLKLTTDQA